MTLKTYRAQ
ncbi:hypothetical protein V1477_010274 [Vespula maculifrons]|uniref:Uncharacterized protein n=1 Tax=Vespula maculifrons TaxID=7453 RepID=A0ABD2CA93_VESMC